MVVLPWGVQLLLPFMTKLAQGIPTLSFSSSSLFFLLNPPQLFPTNTIPLLSFIKGTTTTTFYHEGISRRSPKQGSFGGVGAGTCGHLCESGLENFKKNERTSVCTNTSSTNSHHKKARLVRSRFHNWISCGILQKSKRLCFL